MALDPDLIKKLFVDPDMFDSADAWSEAGFKIVRSSENKICVASHKLAEGYLFKKYVNSGKRDSLKDQLDNYETRIEGARKLRDLIDEQHLRHVVVPRKWLRELPSNFGSRKQPAHILVVERLDLLDADASEREYGRIDADALRELCIVLHAFRGLDSTAKNVPFTTDGKIAFIDTEHWDRHSGKSKQRKFLRYIEAHLSSDRRGLAKKLWNSLEGGAGDDFDDEEDTSSSS
jgi:hypothetical protein